MKNEMFEKLLASKRNELDYRLMDYYYNDDLDINRKVTFMFAQYTDILSDIAHTATGLCRSDDAIQLTPKQIDDITGGLGGLFLEYLIKAQGITIGDALQSLFDDILDDIQEDNNDEK